MAESRRCHPLDDGSTKRRVLLLEAAHVSKAEGQDMLAWATRQRVLPEKRAGARTFDDPPFVVDVEHRPFPGPVPPGAAAELEARRDGTTRDDPDVVPLEDRLRPRLL